MILGHPSPPLILSPLRKIQRLTPAVESSLSDQNLLHNFNRFDVVLNLSPGEILCIEEDCNDFICGVQRNGSACRKSLYCRRHLFEERRGVKRSLPLESLIAEELQNVAWFRKRRLLTKLYYDCKAYWRKHPSALATPMTCSRTSCVHEKSNASSAPRHVSSGSQGSSRKVRGRGFALLKDAFLNKLARSTDEHKDDFVSYLYLQLSCYAETGVEIRARELEARYSASDNELSYDIDEF